MKQQPDLENKPDGALPPRRTKHPSEKGKWLRLFYMSLLLLFIALTIGLIWWGRQLTGAA